MGPTGYCTVNCNCNPETLVFIWDSHFRTVQDFPDARFERGVITEFRRDEMTRQIVGLDGSPVTWLTENEIKSRINSQIFTDCLESCCCIQGEVSGQNFCFAYMDLHPLYPQPPVRCDKTGQLSSAICQKKAKNGEAKTKSCQQLLASVHAYMTQRC